MESGNDSKNKLDEAASFYGNGQFDKALPVIKNFAEQGNALAQYLLGNCYYNGEGVKKDFEQAAEWYSKAAEQGHAEAQISLGNCYLDGDGVRKSNLKGIRWLTRSVDSKANATDNGKETFEWLLKAAEQGNANAQYSLGEHYDSIQIHDYETAIQWFRKAAEQGHAKAQWQLGNFYDRGKAVEKDHAKAAEWWRKSAEQGNADAKRLLEQSKIKKGSGVLSNEEIDAFIENL